MNESEENEGEQAPAARRNTTSNTEPASSNYYSEGPRRQTTEDETQFVRRISVIPLVFVQSSSQVSASTAFSPNDRQAHQANTPTPSHSPIPRSQLFSKPFKCPKPGCTKSYRQANGLKYHMTHGSCNFASPKDLEDRPLSEAELRPYACGIGDCMRRYRNMNGLREYLLLVVFLHQGAYE